MCAQFAHADSFNSGEVIRVVDGDTIVVKSSNKIERIRLIGIDAPEMIDKKSGVAQCYAKKAKEELSKMVFQKKVRIAPDTKNKNRDIYGRLLRYVTVDSDKRSPSINELLIQKGAVRLYKRYDFEYLTLFQKQEKTARETQLGLWKKTVCSYGK